MLSVPSNAYRNRIRDAVHGFIRLSDSEIRFIDFPEFQRLRRIRQLALTLFEGGGQTARCLVWEFEDVVIAHVVEDWYEQAGGYIAVSYTHLVMENVGDRRVRRLTGRKAGGLVKGEPEGHGQVDNVCDIDSCLLYTSGPRVAAYSGPIHPAISG